MHTNDSEYNGHCCKTSQHGLAIIANYVLAKFPSIAPCTAMALNAMAVVAKGCNMCWPKLLVVFLK
jgi:lipoate-protein ligase B